ncbi:hypothetical protein [Gaiella occulta]|nr:hypothetical protein [Gaiella occulta]
MVDARGRSWPPMLVAVTVAAAALLLAPAARSSRVAVVVVPPAAVSSHAAGGAVGLLVPAAGATVTRAGAVRSLVTGRSFSSFAGDTGEAPRIRLSSAPSEVTIYVSLPPPGRHHNVVRYPLAIVGGGYRGILVSRSTRIDGLVSIADIAPTALALARGTPPPIAFRMSGTAAEVAALDRRMTRAHDSRGPATVALAMVLGALAAAAIVTRSPAISRAALLAAPAAISVALLLSFAAVRAPAAVGLLIAAGGGAAALAGACSERLFAPLIALFLAAFLALLASAPETNALAAIGPHPDGGVRFYGVTNQVETLLLAPALAAAAVSRRWFVCIGLLGLVTVGWSRAGADGGGVLVLLAALAVPATRQRRTSVSGARVALAAVAGGAAAAALVAVDALSGGSSHVTRALAAGPSTLLDDFWRRLHVTWGGATASWHAALLCALGIAALAVLATRSPLSAPVAAVVAGLAVSLVVNDSPVDELVWGALGCAALWAHERSCRPTSRSCGRDVRRASPAPVPRRA